MKKRDKHRINPADNKIAMPFEKAVERLLAAKPKKQASKPAKKKPG